MGIVSNLEALKYLNNSPSRIVLCHGVFDVLHEGHLNYLEEAATLGDLLIVSVTTDRYVNKGPGRPYFSHNTRARMLAALETIDYVIINDEPTATNVINQIKPKFYVKGPDYKNRENDLTKGIYEEESAVINNGGEIIFTDQQAYSSSTLINKFFNHKSEEQNEAIDKVKAAGGINTIVELFKDIEKFYVTVVGEPIVDTYTFCVPEGISSKSATISSRYISEENYAGGSLAIANHIADFVKEVYLHAPHGKEAYYQEIKKNLVDKRIMYSNCVLQNYITPRKTRFIDHEKSQRMFELTNITTDIWKNNNPKLVMNVVKNNSKDSHLTILCDFGHGLFENVFLSSSFDFGSFTALNCQTNSSNFGFNPYTKHQEIDYLSIDLREARVAFHDKTSSAESLFEKIKVNNSSMTLGCDGALYKNTNSNIKVPAFADRVVDTIGAGDAYYAITSLLVRAKAPPEIIPFVGNIFAGLKTKILGNKYSVTKSQLLKAVDSILK